MTATTKHIPSKRVRNWHRNSGSAESLKTYAGNLTHSEERATVKQWLANKAASK